MRRTAALTLVELLVATALGVLVVSMTWIAFARSKSTVARTTALVSLHQSAAVLQDAFERDFGNLAPALAMFASSTPSVSGSTRSERVEVVFMRSTAPLDKQASQGTYDRYVADHHWVRWLFTRTLAQVGGVWQVQTASLKRSDSTPIRWWQTTSALAPPSPVIDPASGSSKSNYNGANWVNIPRPLRDASGGVASLDFNRYGVPAGAVSANTPIGDIGDLADLVANEQVVSNQVVDFQLGWVEADGQAVAIDGQTATVRNLDGLYMDVVGPDNGRYLDRRQDPCATPPGAALVGGSPQYDYRPDLRQRPRVFRIALRMQDAATGVGQTFTFAVAAPGLVPPINQPAP